MSRKQPARPGRTVSPPAIEDRPAGSPGSRMGRPTRLILIGGAVLLVLVAVAVVLARPALEARFGGAPAGVGGRILLPTDTGLTVFDLAQRRDTPVMTAPPGQIVTSVAWSPDRKLIAYGFFHRRPGDPASVSEIYLVGADGSDPRVLAERDRPGAVLDTPVWSPDGREVYFSYFGQVSGKPIQRIERVTVATGERQTVVEDGYAPDVSPDGKSLLFLRDERAGSGLWLAPLAGGDPTS